MRSAYVLFPVLCAAPFLASCTSLGTTMASYGVSSMVKAQHSNETPEMYYDVGRYYQAQNRWDNAARAYERALSLRKDYVEAANALATCYAMQRQYDRAVAQLEDAIKQSPEAAYLKNNLGYVYYLQDKLPEAIAALEAATSAEPENGRAWRNLALAYGKAGAADKSRAAYARANRATPRALLDTWKASHPVATESGIAARDERRTAAPEEPTAGAPAAVSAMPAQPAAAASAAGQSGARTEASMEVISVGKNTYELRVVPPATVAVPASPAAAVAQPAAAVKNFRVEVSNGNGTTGMARRVAHSLKQAGVNTVRLTNQMPWQRASEIQFSAGYALEAAKLAGMLGHELLTVRNDKLRRDINVRLVLGKDVRDETAFVAPPPGGASTKIASAK